MQLSNTSLQQGLQARLVAALAGFGAGAAGDVRDLTALMRRRCQGLGSDVLVIRPEGLIS